MYACKIGSLQARQKKSHLGSPQILHLWGERRQWSHQRFSGAVSFFANHLTNATLIYPAKCERTFEGVPIFDGGGGRRYNNFCKYANKKEKKRSNGRFFLFQLSTFNFQFSIFNFQLPFVGFQFEFPEEALHGSSTSREILLRDESRFVCRHLREVFSACSNGC